MLVFAPPSPTAAFFGTFFSDTFALEPYYLLPQFHYIHCSFFHVDLHLEAAAATSAAIS